jgi:hypothetical protein
MGEANGACVGPNSAKTIAPSEQHAFSSTLHRGLTALADQGTFLNCECVGVPSGAFVRLASVLLVRDSIPE